MSSKNEVFEYLIDQLRQQVNKKDVTSFNVSVRISDLDDVKQVIHNLQQHIAGKDDEIRALKDSLRQQVNNNQCEDLAHEVQSLKNQLRDASVQIKELHLGLGKAAGGVEDYKLIRKGKFAPEQSGCRKEDVQECAHEWCFYNKGALMMCRICGLKSPGRQKENTQECEHDWRVVQYSAGVETNKCRLCGEEKEVRYEQSGCRKEDVQKCKHEWQFYGVGFPCMCLKCGLKK